MTPGAAKKWRIIMQTIMASEKERFPELLGILDIFFLQSKALTLCNSINLLCIIELQDVYLLHLLMHCLSAKNKNL